MLWNAVTRRTRGLIWLPDGPGNAQLLLATGILTVLVTRALLASLGYPQVGNGSLHIAHALWGGLLLLVAVGTLLAFGGRVARVTAALLAGVGWGLFVDEVGKFITQNNNYFFRPAVAVIYIVFAVLLLLTARYRDRAATRNVAYPAALSHAAVIVGAGLSTGLSASERTSVARLLANRDDEATRLVQRLLELAPDRTATSPLRHILTNAARRLAAHPWTPPVLIALFVVSRVVVAIVFLAPAGDRHESGALLASAVLRPLEALLAVVGALRWRANRRSALGWFAAALYLNLFVTQLFNFTDSQFAALAEFPFLLLMLAWLAIQRS